MRFKRQRDNQLPEVNLVPMMDVLMTVLTFFIIVSMTLTGQQIPNMMIPRTDGSGAGEDKRARLTVGLNADRQIILDNRTLDVNGLLTEIQQFLSTNPDGLVVLKAHRELDYQDVSTLLRQMRDAGGENITLAIERN